MTYIIVFHCLDMIDWLFQVVFFGEGGTIMYNAAMNMCLCKHMISFFLVR